MNPFSEVSFAIVTIWFDPFGQRDSVVSVYQEAAALGQFPYLSEKRSVFAALVALRPQIRKLSRFPVRRIIDRDLRRLRSIFGLFSRRYEGSSSFQIR
jgi:hypothetical protein